MNEARAQSQRDQQRGNRNDGRAQQQQQQQSNRDGRQDSNRRAEYARQQEQARQNQRQDRRDDRREDRRDDFRADRRQDRREDRQDDRRDARISQRAQQNRIAQQRNRADAYRHYQSEAQQRQSRHARSLNHQRRSAYRYQQSYYDRLSRQQSRLLSHRYNYNTNAFFYAPASYSYYYGGSRHTTNRYGADLLRQAVNYGYEEGFYAGQADRQDGWRADVRNSYAYIDASYGYDNFYVDRGDYNYYFREGFQRGYEDGYYSRSRHGHYRNGSASILDGVLASILNLQSY